MFLGEFAHSLDSESRLALPARLREAAGEELGEGLRLVCGAEPCIVAYTRSRLEALLAGLAADEAVSKPSARDFKRALGSRAAVAVPDRQGRIRIPEPLRVHAGVEKDVVVVGVVDAIEIWDAAAYRAREEALKGAYMRVAQRIFG